MLSFLFIYSTYYYSYLTASEWKHLYGGKKDGHGDSKDLSDYRRLPLDHCSLSLQPYENPYCDEDGNIFDLAHIVPYIKKHKSNPVTGKLLEARMLTKLNFHKNSKGEFHCPVMFKVLNNNVHVAAIKTTGNVYAYEAVEEMNIKTKNWKDLLNDEPFVRNDIIVLQDPKDYSKFNLAKFHHIKNSIKLDNEGNYFYLEHFCPHVILDLHSNPHKRNIINFINLLK